MSWQKGMSDIEDKEFRNVTTTFNNENGLTNEMILEQLDKANSYNIKVLEGACGKIK